MGAFCLTFHARYACAQSGACCTAGWPIPIESERLKNLVRCTAGARGGAADTPVNSIPIAADGACIFFDRHRGRLCAIQRDLGIEAMPTACRNFPRVSLRDPRGIFITLSHFCPTAARLLLHADDIAIVEAPPSLSLHGAVDGLDATTVMPPLLRPGMLMDFEGYTIWERAAIGVLNDRRYSARFAVDLIAQATQDASGWGPGGEPLASRIGTAFDRARSSPEPCQDTRQQPYEHPVKAFLAAHLFASWAGYQGGGMKSIVDAVSTALDLVGTEFSNDNDFIDAARAADLRLRHSADSAPPRSCRARSSATARTATA
jgi:hypothetical protein